MKTTKKLLSILLAMVMLFTLALPAFAATNGTITVTEAVNGEKYTLIKLFDATVASDREEGGDGITYTGTIPDALIGIFETNAQGQIVIKDGNSTKGLLTTTAEETILGWAKTVAQATDPVSPYVIETKTAADNKVEFTELGDGYYVVVSAYSNGAAVNVTSITPSISVVDKNEGDTPTIPNDRLKNIVAANGDLVATTTAKTGDTIEFKVEFKGSNFVKTTNGKDKVYNYVVTDEATGVAIDWSTLKVAVNGTEISSGWSRSDSVITINWTLDGTGNSNSAYNNNSTVTLTYSGTLNEDITTATNKATVTYNGTNNKVIDDPDPVKIFAVNVVVNKYEFDDDGTTVNTEKPLSGAEFKLVKVEGTGETATRTYYHWVEESSDPDDTTKTIPAHVEWLPTENQGDTVPTVNGTLTFKGVDPTGKYELLEVKAPNGYNKLATNPAVEIVSTTETQGETTVITGYTSTNNVGNARGTVLPSTGGIGTTIFYVVGGLLVLGAAVVLVSKKRMGNQQ